MLDAKPIVIVVERILAGGLSPAEVGSLVGAICAQSYLLGAQDTLERIGVSDAATETAAVIARARA